MPDARIAALTALTCAVTLGTAYSLYYNTYLDTSDPHITNLPHHLASTDYFASKSNPLNVYFIKYAWAWTTLAFLFHFLTSPPNAKTMERVAKFAAETGVWMVFTSWFFGPAVFDRLLAASGGECVVNLPSGYILSVPNEYCYTKSTISPATHPGLFAASLLVPDAHEWNGGKARLRRGHDVSGHVFLLVMATLFLADQVRTSWRRVDGVRGVGGRSGKGSTGGGKWSKAHTWAVGVNIGLIGLWLFASWTTSVYFHSPMEKLTGFLLGLAGFSVTLLPIFQPEIASVPYHTPAAVPKVQLVSEKPVAAN
ncbi:hypothetical protein JAAARDRAFT_69860 [Jaapia argillacea MUCL 33604]|uniref:Inositol phospholipid synthesis and fat-storage-inducing TM-domain-containing protein n=1 Tax=Jaapia argillacea MUCL 33604 TaxID=933084 RepID=A0A067PSI2_9AGAM|nr:hypothetical protein JAAARDRAFT_69860 [Jaapia argillacea MUCL 33604]